MEIWEETSDTLASMCRQGYRLLDSGPVEEYPRWRALAEQGHWLYDTAHERVKAGTEAAKARGKRLGRPSTPSHLVTRAEELAGRTDMSIRQIQEALNGRVSRSVVGEIVKRIRSPSQAPSL